MNKTDLLFQMMEQPHRYTADEWQEILADEECRELYTLMSKTQSAVNAIRADREISDDIIDAEWQRLRSEKTEVKSEKYSFLKIAAMFVGILMLSGIAYATYHLMSAPHSAPEGATIAIVADASEASSGNGGGAIHFDDVRLDSILSVVSSHYGKTTHFRSDEAKAMKFIMTWVPDSSLSSFIDGLNMFDGLQLTLLRDTIFVEVQEGKEDMK